MESEGISCGDGHSSAGAECSAGDSQAYGDLLALVFVAVYLSDYIANDRFVESGADDLVGGLFPLHVSLQNRVEYVVGRQGILVSLVFFEFG